MLLLLLLLLLQRAIVPCPYTGTINVETLVQSLIDRKTGAPWAFAVFTSPSF
jgi:hypothetical protein